MSSGTARRGSVLRTLLALVLVLAAALLAVAAAAGAAVDRLAHTAEPLRTIAGPLADDAGLREQLAGRVADGLLEQVPSRLPVPDFLQERLEDTVNRTATGLWEDPDFKTAWLETVDRSRSTYVSQLERERTGQGPHARLSLELQPLASLGLAKLRDQAAAVGLGQAVAAWQPDLATSIDLGVPQAGSTVAEVLPGLLTLAERWAWWAGGAAIAAIAALVAARPGTRWAVPAVGGAAVVVLGGLGVAWAGGLPEAASAGMANADPLARTAVERLADGASVEAARFAWTTLWAGTGVILVAVVTRVLGGIPTNR